MPTLVSGRQRRGFTLIELLVVVSIIALLISLLLPALGNARRMARIAKCTANMKQHAVALASYASQNDDKLLNAPESPGPDTSPLGRKGQPANFFGVKGLLETNGWAFAAGGGDGDSGVGGVPMIIPNNYQGSPWWLDDIAACTMFDFYIPQLGPYMVDGEGPAMLSEVFISPSDNFGRESWEEWRTLIREDGGQVAHPASQSMERILVGSYRYPQQAMISSVIFSRDINGRRSAEYTAQIRQSRLAPQYVVYNRNSDIAFPDRKVMFFTLFSYHDAGPIDWTYIDGKTATVAVADGSAKALKPSFEAAPKDDIDLSGPFFTTTGGAVQPHFVATNGGLRGRDL